jgi:hypothetical protein
VIIPLVVMIAEVALIDLRKLCRRTIMSKVVKRLSPFSQSQHPNKRTFLMNEMIGIGLGI